MRISYVITGFFAAIVLAQPAAAAQKQPATNNANRGAVSSSQPRQPTDCHRDVLEHRINGVKIRHRHVGGNCQVRIVRQAS